MCNKINILWIEDNPLQFSRKIIEDGIEYTLPKFSIDVDIDDHFNLKILQHPEEIKEYLTMCNKLLNDFGSKIFEKCSAIVPDIVVTDYMLSQSFDTDNDKAISYLSSNRKVREKFIPMYSIAQAFPQLFKTKDLFSENAIGYTKATLFNKINPENTSNDIISKDIEQSTNDEFGLYAGITILRFFKNHITTLIPATQKTTKDVLGSAAKYFEWLNEYDLKVAFDRKQRKKKDWESLISESVVMLQQRIINQVKSKTIKLSFENLLEILSGKADSLIIYTDFLRKDLPLAALFYDQKEPEIRREVVNKFINDLFNEIFENVAEFKTAENVASLLWDSYTSPKSALRRRLSDLLARASISKHTNIYKFAPIDKKDKWIHFSLSKKEYSWLFFLRDLFKVDCSKDQIHSELKRTGDFSILTKDLKSHGIKRLVFLFMVIKLINRWSQFKSNNTELIEGLGLHNSNIGNLEPDYDDLLMTLYPVAESPLIYHTHSDILNEIPNRKKEARTTVRKIWDNRTAALNFRPTDFGSCLDVSSQITIQERFILKQYLLSTDNIQLLSNRHCPEWIKYL